MLGRTNNQRYLLWLALGTAAMALAMASLLVFELAQKRAVEQSNAIRSDSLTALSFQFEREFLRMRQTVGETLASPKAPDTDALSLRYDIFQSRLTLLRDSPGLSLLVARPEFSKMILQLDPLVGELGKAISSNPVDRKALAAVQVELNSLGSGVQALTLAADSEVSRLLEHQADTMRQQSDLIVWLTVAQLVLLTVASGALVLRQRRLEAERLALEQLTEDLHDARLRAEAANRGKSQFLANMSHELRTPFNGLIGMLSLLQGTEVSPQQADYIQTAQGSASHLLSLLNDILDLSSLEAGKMTLKPGPVLLVQMLGNVNALMQPLAKDKGLAFDMQLPSVPLPAVIADETRVKQILFNLISNAIKFTQEGKVQLTVTESARTSEALEITFAVQDTGIGMNDEVLSRLFQRFYQVDDTSTRRFGGTGLGLEISQSLARMMNGDITVTSTVGKGSTFTTVLRLPVSDHVFDSPSAKEPMEPFVVEPARSSTGAMRILVVEDHPINQKLVGVLLGRMGCDLTFCENGQMAVDRVQQEVFDMVLMDVNMPVMDGLSATRLIRALPGPVARIPIVVFTADVMNDANEQAMAAGANDFITKPVKIEELRALVQKYASSQISIS
jgi:two-component system, sensor histidine kinase